MSTYLIEERKPDGTYAPIGYFYNKEDADKFVSYGEDGQYKYRMI